MDENEAITRLKRGDINGLENLVKLYQLEATRTAFLITRDHQLAEDIVQNAFLKCYERIQQFDSKRAFRPWFMRIVVNDALKVVARRPATISLYNSPTENSIYEELAADDSWQPLEMLERVEMNKAIWDGLGQLSPVQRASLVLRYYNNLSESEMATQLNVAPGTVKSRLHAARQQLRSILTAHVR